MISYSVYVVDDEDSIRSGLTAVLKGKYRTSGFPTAEDALAAAKEEIPDLVLLDLGLPGMSGIDALRELKSISPDIQVIVITAYEDVRSAVSAMKFGAHDYILKPLQMETLEVSIRNALATVRFKKEVEALQELALRENMPDFVGKSDTIQDVMELVGTLAKSSDTPILILGETGTGKELIASAIHYRSPNFNGPLISVNCAAIPRDLVESELFGYERGAFTGASASGKTGLVEKAAGGTLFLDEIGDLGIEAQSKLLRFLEEGVFYRVGGTKSHKVSTRVVSATNKKLEELIEKGLFREDLYYRLAVARIEVPSLNERPDDILPMACHFLLEFNRKFGRNFTGFTPDTEAALKAYRWKGNVRELKNIVERGTLVGKGAEISMRDLCLKEMESKEAGCGGDGNGMELPEFPPGGIDLDNIVSTVEKLYFEEALRRTGGNESQAAKLLNLNHHTFRYRRKKLRI
ncbi:MAG TPA: sigma-54 dependent transcriptional regulator [Candidatus Deferrimicrobiaceae bacterium]|jgi:DNA-binding NtrC family response regulator